MAFAQNGNYVHRSAACDISSVLFLLFLGREGESREKRSGRRREGERREGESRERE